MAEKKEIKGNELDDLLDDALKDFNKTDVKNEANSGSGAAGNKAANSNDSAAAATAGTEAASSDSDAFFLEQAQILADRMSTLFGGPNTPSGDIPPLPQDPDQIMAGFKKMAEAAALTLQGENSATDEDVAKYSDSIAQALKGLQEGSDNLSAPILDTDVANMFSGLNLDGAAGTDGDSANMFLPFMEGMMQSLLSAEILLPSIKELVEKYPKYLAENGDKISAEDKERYEKQLELYKIIQANLELENPNDSAAVKREKFRVVLDDMRKLQEFGQPPEEILKETAGDLPMFDPSTVGDAAAAAGGANPQCPMM